MRVRDPFTLKSKESYGASLNENSGGHGEGEVNNTTDCSVERVLVEIPYTNRVSRDRRGL